MAWAWSSFGALTLFASLMLLLLSALFLRSRLTHFNLAFAGYTAASALQKGAAAFALYIEQDPETAAWWFDLALWSWIPIDAAFLHSVVAFASPSGRPRRAWPLAIYGAAVALTVFVAADPRRLDALFWPPWHLFVGLSVVLFALALMRSRTARTTLGRKEAKFVAIYLGVATPFLIEGLVLYLMNGRLPLWEIASAYALATGIMLVGILRHQVFDIDLKIKWTINRGTLVGIFLAVFFVVSVTAENFLTERYGWAVGGAGAGLLLFALTPLQRLADRLSTAAMPHVRDDPDYLAERRLEVYRVAVEGALFDGSVSLRERQMLARLADHLGLTASEAVSVEEALSRPARA